jgi:hypothetical protein
MCSILICFFFLVKYPTENSNNGNHGNNV